MTIEEPASPSIETERAEALKRLQAKRDFGRHLVSYVVINGLLIVVWATSGHGYFWPGWLMGAWGFGLLMHAWDVWWRRPITEADINAEVQRTRRQQLRGTRAARRSHHTPA